MSSSEPAPGTQPCTWIVAGPTASGKTALALAVARRLPVEVISVDSALVYRGMDIGTAKPTAQELAQVPHHLIDVIDPHESYSAARFVRDAQALVHDIRVRGKHPLLVGGTMLYIKALVHGLDEMPTVDPALRGQIDAQARQRGWPALHAELAEVDPVTAARLAPHDAQRIQRALEVWRSSGRPLSAFQTQLQTPRQPPTHTTSVAGADVPSPAAPAGWRLMSLEPNDRTWLHRRIAERFELMLGQGLIDEVRALRCDPRLHAGLSSTRCVGYRQVWEALDLGWDLAEPGRRHTVKEQGVAATRQLAKRQITWLRSMPWRQAVACDDAQAVAHATEALVQALQA